MTKVDTHTLTYIYYLFRSPQYMAFTEIYFDLRSSSCVVIGLVLEEPTDILSQLVMRKYLLFLMMYTYFCFFFRKILHLKQCA